VKWVELSVQVHPEAVDAVANVFQERGTGGVAIEQAVEPHIEGEETARFAGLPVVRAYLPLNASAAERERDIEQALWHLQAFDLAPVGPVTRREIDEEDWANAWKEHFHPLVVGRIVIKPSWRSVAAEPHQVVVELDPGMAFGTGLHPTTRLMLDALQPRVTAGTRVLDLGTGSGILAIAAALLGATAIGLDVSDVAVEVARSNVAANGLDDRVSVAHGSIDGAGERRFNLILANIIASVLIELAPAIADRLEPGGEVLASGIIDERLDGVREAFERAGLDIISVEADEDWRLLVARRPG